MQIPALVPARDSGRQNVHTIRKTVNWNDPLITAPRDPFACLPKGSFISRLVVEIVTAFTGTTPTLTVGTTTANANEVIASGDSACATAGVKPTITTGLGRSLTAAADTYLYVKMTGTGVGAGKAIVIVEFIPDTDM